MDEQITAALPNSQAFTKHLENLGSMLIETAKGLSSVPFSRNINGENEVNQAKQTCKPSSVSFNGRTAAIYLAPVLPPGSSDQPGDRTGLSTSPYLVLLRMGFSRPPIFIGAGELLPRHFTLTLQLKGGMFLLHFP